MSPFLLILAGCASAPEPRSPHRADTEQWDGSGGAAGMRNRGEALADFALQAARHALPLRWRDARRFRLQRPRVLRASAARPRRAAHLARPGRTRPTSVKPRKLQRGDLVFFKIDSRKVNHVGIYIGKHRFVHAPGAGKPVTINSLDDEFYAETFFSAGRFWNRLPH